MQLDPARTVEANQRRRDPQADRELELTSRLGRVGSELELRRVGRLLGQRSLTRAAGAISAVPGHHDARDQREQGGDQPESEDLRPRARPVGDAKQAANPREDPLHEAARAGFAREARLPQDARCLVAWAGELRRLPTRAAERGEPRAQLRRGRAVERRAQVDGPTIDVRDALELGERRRVGGRARRELDEPRVIDRVRRRRRDEHQARREGDDESPDHAPVGGSAAAEPASKSWTSRPSLRTRWSM